MDEGDSDGADTLVPQRLKLLLDLRLIGAGQDANNFTRRGVLDDIGGLGDWNGCADERLQGGDALANLRVSSAQTGSSRRY